MPKYKKAIPNFKGWREFFGKKGENAPPVAVLRVLFLHDADEVLALEVVAVFHAETRIHGLLGEDLDGEQLVAAFQTALEGQVHRFRVVVAEDDVLGLDAFHVLFLLLAQLDVAVQFAVLGNRVSPELAATAGLLADFELDTLLFLVFG